MNVKTFQSGWDKYCWRCHLHDTNLYCSCCIRSYHANCLKMKVLTPGEMHKWQCPECVEIKLAEKENKKKWVHIGIEAFGFFFHFFFFIFQKIRRKTFQQAAEIRHESNFTGPKRKLNIGNCVFCVCALCVVRTCAHLCVRISLNCTVNFQMAFKVSQVP